MITLIYTIIPIVLVVIGALFDIKEKRIPNKLTFPSIIVGFIGNLIVLGFQGIPFSFLGFLAGFLVFMLPYALGAMGAGDVKLMAAVGAIMGWKFTLISALYTTIAGLIVALPIYIYKRIYPRYAIAYTQNAPVISNDKIYVPYGLCIAIGVIFVIIGRNYPNLPLLSFLK